MKKSNLRSLIRECISEVLTEIRLGQLFQQFATKYVPLKHRDDFNNKMYPFFNKLQENPAIQRELALKMATIAAGKPLSDADKSDLKDYGLDVNDPKTVGMLRTFHPFLADFYKFVKQSA